MKSYTDSPPALVGTDRPHMRNITLHRPSQIRLNLQILQRVFPICARLALARPWLGETRPIAVWYRAGRADGRWPGDGGVGGGREEGGECSDLGFRQGGDEGLFVYLQAGEDPGGGVVGDSVEGGQSDLKKVQYGLVRLLDHLPG